MFLYINTYICWPQVDLKVQHWWYWHCYCQYLQTVRSLMFLVNLYGTQHIYRQYRKYRIICLCFKSRDNGFILCQDKRRIFKCLILQCTDEHTTCKCTWHSSKVYSFKDERHNTDTTETNNTVDHVTVWQLHSHVLPRLPHVIWR